MIVCESLLSTSFSLGFSLVGVESFKSFWMLSSTTSPLCNEFLACAKSLTETVDSRPLVNLMCAYWGFALSNTTSSTNGSYLLAWTWRRKKTGSGVDNQVGKE